ncbi:MAG: periplasmic heavy metal sensor [Gammaproteobacteria bacterium]
MKYLNTAVIITALAVGGLGMSTVSLASEQDRHQSHGGACWRSSLTEEQSVKIDPLHTEYKKQTAPLKAKMHQAKVDLALLMTADNPKLGDIDKKIDELARLKAEKMRLMARHKIEVRKLLTAEQRSSFDRKILSKAERRKQHYGHH